MTDSVQSAGTPAAAKPTFWQKASNWAYIVLGFVFIAIGAIKVIDAFTLPSCTAERTDTTIRDIFKSKNVELTKITDMKTVSQTSSERTCTAHVESKDETANIDYKISWNGWTAQVLIATVRDEKQK